MHQLIEELHASHRIVADKPPIVVSSVNLAEIIRNTVEEFAAAACSKRITVRTEGPAFLPLESDASALGKVVSNLLPNAIKYTPRQTTVTVTWETDATHMRFRVRDQGPGVKPEECDSIFDQYGRGSAQPTAGESSHGLGLWIVRLLVTDLGGRVWCDVGAGPGAYFQVELPLRASRGVAQ